MEEQMATISITLTLPAAARLLGVSETLARQMAREGRFPGAFNSAVFGEFIDKLSRSKSHAWLEGSLSSIRKIAF